MFQFIKSILKETKKLINFGMKVEGQASLDGALHTTVVKSQQSNGKQNFQFGEMKIVIVLTINQSPTIFFVPAIVKAALMRVKVFCIE